VSDGSAVRHAGRRVIFRDEHIGLRRPHVGNGRRGAKVAVGIDDEDLADRRQELEERLRRCRDAGDLLIEFHEQGDSIEGSEAERRSFEHFALDTFHIDLDRRGPRRARRCKQRLE
jgi:hypothetical protein